MSTRSYPDFIIKEVTPLRGAPLRALHYDVLGRPAYIEDVEEGYRGLLMYQPDYDDRFHRLHTSTIQSIEADDDGKTVVINTANTQYILQRTNDDDATFRGVRCFTMDDSRKAVKDLFEKLEDVDTPPAAQMEWYATEFRTAVRECGYAPSDIKNTIWMYYWSNWRDDE